MSTGKKTLAPGTHEGEAARAGRADPGIGITRGAGRQLLTAEEVAEMLGMTVQWVWEQSRKGTIPTITLGRKKRYRREAIEQWLRELEATAT